MLRWKHFYCGTNFLFFFAATAIKINAFPDQDGVNPSIIHFNLGNYFFLNIFPIIKKILDSKGQRALQIEKQKSKTKAEAIYS